ncbi:MAG: hypothetical protein Q9163_002924 [Psora crenata]
MEIAGLAVGVAGLAGLFSACTEAIDRVESYRKFAFESRYLSAQFHADRLFLEKWADGVGLSKDRLLEPHDQRLDDPTNAAAVGRILTSIQDILAATNATSSRLDLDAGPSGSSHQLRGPNLTLLNRQINLKPSSVRSKDKLSWALGGKGTFANQVEVFKVLVEKLYNLVPLQESPAVSTDLLRQFGNLSGILNGMSLRKCLTLEY